MSKMMIKLGGIMLLGVGTVLAYRKYVELREEMILEQEMVNVVGTTVEPEEIE